MYHLFHYIFNAFTVTLLILFIFYFILFLPFVCLFLCFSQRILYCIQSCVKLICFYSILLLLFIYSLCNALFFKLKSKSNVQNHILFYSLAEEEDFELIHNSANQIGLYLFVNKKSGGELGVKFLSNEEIALPKLGTVYIIDIFNTERVTSAFHAIEQLLNTSKIK
jgi:hypothetical protein